MDPPSWDILDTDWPNLTGWTATGSGTYLNEINPASQLHQVAGNFVGLDYALVQRADLGNIPSLFTFEIKAVLDQASTGLPVGTTFDGIISAIQNGQHMFQVYMNTNSIGYYRSGGTQVWFGATTIVNNNIFYKRICCDSTTPSIRVYLSLDGINWTEDIDANDPYVLVTGDGTAKLFCYQSKNDVIPEHHIEYTRIATGLWDPTDAGGVGSKKRFGNKFTAPLFKGF